MPQIHSLTPLRGIAALLVVGFHIGFYLPELRTSATYAVFYSGYLGVDFFFLLSGFIMAHVYGRYFDKTVAWKNYRRFIWARLARIYPLHLFVLLLLLVLVSVSQWWFDEIFFLPLFASNEQRFSTASFWSNVFLINSLHLHDYLSWNQQAWSISTEWAVYLLFPFAVPYLVRQPYLLIVFSSMGLLVLLMFERHYGHLTITVNNGFIRCLVEFFIGIALYKVYASAYARALLGTDWVMLMVILLIAFVLHRPDVMKVWVIMLFGLLILTAAWNSGFFNRLLNSRALLWLGNISYSIYMLHLLCLEGVYWLWHYRLKISLIDWFGVYAAHALILLMMLAVILLVSWFTYHLVELPARRLLKNAVR